MKTAQEVCKIISQKYSEAKCTYSADGSTVNRYIRVTRDISVLSGGISMKVATNIYHVSCHSLTGFRAHKTTAKVIYSWPVYQTNQSFLKRRFRTAQANWGKDEEPSSTARSRIEAPKRVWGGALFLALNMMSLGAFWVVFLQFSYQFYTQDGIICQLATTHFTD